MSRLLICDGNPLAWRSAQIYENLRTKSGIQTGIIFGALENLIRGVTATKPDSIIVTWDINRSRWRKELLPSYKCSRDVKKSASQVITIDNVAEQMLLTRKILDRAGVHQIGVPGVEADDLIGILSSAFDQTGSYDEVVIMSQDHDLHQLIRGRVKFYEPVKKQYITPDFVREKFSGFGPDDLTQIMALTGDGGDDIPGINGIGDVYAVKFLKEFGSLEALLDPANDDRLKTSKRGQSIIDGRDIIRKALKLVTVPKVDDFSQYLNQAEISAFVETVRLPPQADRFSFIGLAEQYELRKFIGSVDTILRDPPNFSGFEKWFEMTPERNFESDANLFWER